jgi:hypothetical protein
MLAPVCFASDDELPIVEASFHYRVTSFLSRVASMSDIHQVIVEFIDQFVDAMTPEVAAKIVNVRLSEERQATMAKLFEKANDGLLGKQERDEYEDVLTALEYVSIFRLRLRKKFNLPAPEHCSH